MTTLRVRLADPPEYDAVGALTVAGYVADGHLVPGDPYAAVLRDAAQRARDAELLVAVDADDDAIVGTVTFCVAGTPYAEVSHPGEAEFRTLATAPGARGRGVGTALVVACLDRARALGASRVVISSGDWMLTAHRLYSRLGFVRLPDRDWSPIPGVDLLAFSRELVGGER